MPAERLQRRTAERLRAAYYGLRRLVAKAIGRR
jgi:hypothetical protein